MAKIKYDSGLIPKLPDQTVVNVDLSEWTLSNTDSVLLISATDSNTVPTVTEFTEINKNSSSGASLYLGYISDASTWNGNITYDTVDDGNIRILILEGCNQSSLIDVVDTVDTSGTELDAPNVTTTEDGTFIITAIAIYGTRDPQYSGVARQLGGGTVSDDVTTSSLGVAIGYQYTSGTTDFGKWGWTGDGGSITTIAIKDVNPSNPTYGKHLVEAPIVELPLEATPYDPVDIGLVTEPLYEAKLPNVDFDGANIANNTITKTNHGLPHLRAIKYHNNGNANIPGLSEGVVYSAYVIDADNFQLQVRDTTNIVSITADANTHTFEDIGAYGDGTYDNVGLAKSSVGVYNHVISATNFNPYITDTDTVFMVKLNNINQDEVKSLDGAGVIWFFGDSSWNWATYKLAGNNSLPNVALDNYYYIQPSEATPIKQRNTFNPADIKTIGFANRCNKVLSTPNMDILSISAMNRIVIAGGSALDPITPYNLADLTEFVVMGGSSFVYFKMPVVFGNGSIDFHWEGPTGAEELIINSDLITSAQVQIGAGKMGYTIKATANSSYKDSSPAIGEYFIIDANSSPSATYEIDGKIILTPTLELQSFITADGVVIKDADDITLNGCTLNNSRFESCVQITQGSANLTGTIFKETDVLVSDVSKLENTSFENSDFIIDQDFVDNNTAISIESISFTSGSYIQCTATTGSLDITYTGDLPNHNSSGASLSFHSPDTYTASNGDIISVNYAKIIIPSSMNITLDGIIFKGEIAANPNDLSIGCTVYGINGAIASTATLTGNVNLDSSVNPPLGNFDLSWNAGSNWLEVGVNGGSLDSPNKASMLADRIRIDDNPDIAHLATRNGNLITMSRIRLMQRCNSFFEWDDDGVIILRDDFLSNPDNESSSGANDGGTLIFGYRTTVQLDTSVGRYDGSCYPISSGGTLIFRRDGLNINPFIKKNLRARNDYPTFASGLQPASIQLEGLTYRLSPGSSTSSQKWYFGNSRNVGGLDKFDNLELSGDGEIFQTFNTTYNNPKLPGFVVAGETNSSVVTLNNPSFGMDGVTYTSFNGTFRMGKYFINNPKFPKEQWNGNIDSGFQGGEDGQCFCVRFSNDIQILEGATPVPNFAIRITTATLNATSNYDLSQLVEHPQTTDIDLTTDSSGKTSTFLIDSLKANGTAGQGDSDGDVETYKYTAQARDYSYITGRYIYQDRSYGVAGTLAPVSDTVIVVADENATLTKTEAENLTEINSTEDLYCRAKYEWVVNDNFENDFKVSRNNTTIDVSYLDLILDSNASQVYDITATELAVKSSGFSGDINNARNIYCNDVSIDGATVSNCNSLYLSNFTDNVKVTHVDRGVCIKTVGTYDLSNLTFEVNMNDVTVDDNTGDVTLITGGRDLTINVGTGNNVTIDKSVQVTVKLPEEGGSFLLQNLDKFHNYLGEYADDSTAQADNSTPVLGDYYRTSNNEKYSRYDGSSWITGIDQPTENEITASLLGGPGAPTEFTLTLEPNTNYRLVADLFGYFRGGIDVLTKDGDTYTIALIPNSTPDASKINDASNYASQIVSSQPDAFGCVEVQIPDMSDLDPTTALTAIEIAQLDIKALRGAAGDGIYDLLEVKDGAVQIKDDRTRILPLITYSAHTKVGMPVNLNVIDYSTIEPTPFDANGNYVAFDKTAKFTVPTANITGSLPSDVASIKQTVDTNLDMKVSDVSGGTGGDSKEDIYSYFTSGTNADAFKADVSNSGMSEDDFHTAMDTYANKESYKATGFATVNPDNASIASIKSLVDTNLDAKVSEVGGMSETELHSALDSYTNKDDFKATEVIATNMRGTDNALSSTDSRLDNLDATISSRSTFDSSLETVTTDTASREASKATGFATINPDNTSISDIKSLVDTNLDAKVSEVGGMTESEMHSALDSYTNKDDFKATEVVSTNMRGTDNALSTNDARLDNLANLDATISSRSTFNPSSDLVTTDEASREASKATGFATINPDNSSIEHIKTIVDTNLDAKVSEVGGMSETEMHSALDSYTNKDDYKATGFATINPDNSSIAQIKTAVDTNLDAKVSEVGGMSESEMHSALDSYANKDNFKADVSDLAKEANATNNKEEIKQYGDANWKLSGSNTVDANIVSVNNTTVSSINEFKATETISTNMRGTDNALLSNDSRMYKLNNLDATISSRSTFNHQVDEVTTDESSRLASQATGFNTVVPDNDSIANIKSVVDNYLDAKVSEVGGLTQEELHSGLDNYTNKNAYKADVSDLAKETNATTNRNLIISQGNTAWKTATGFSTLTLSEIENSDKLAMKEDLPLYHITSIYNHVANKRTREILSKTEARTVVYTDDDDVPYRAYKEVLDPVTGATAEIIPYD